MTFATITRLGTTVSFACQIIIEMCSRSEVAFRVNVMNMATLIWDFVIPIPVFAIAGITLLALTVKNVSLAITAIRGKPKVLKRSSEEKDVEMSVRHCLS